MTIISAGWLNFFLYCINGTIFVVTSPPSEQKLEFNITRSRTAGRVFVKFFLPKIFFANFRFLSDFFWRRICNPTNPKNILVSLRSQKKNAVRVLIITEKKLKLGDGDE